MAEQQEQGGGGFGGTLRSKWGPLPVWAWLGIITIAGLAYWWWSNRNSSQQQQQAQAGAPGVVVIDQGNPPVPPPVPRKHHHRRKHGGRGKEGPEREWLEAKTGSERPWTYLRKHDEQVRVGPEGSRTIVGDTPPSPAERPEASSGGAMAQQAAGLPGPMPVAAQTASAGATEG